MSLDSKFVPKGPIDNKPGDKPVYGPMLTKFTDTCAALGRGELSSSFSIRNLLWNPHS